MRLSPDDVIARRAFELLANELPSGDFKLTDEDKYTVNGKCEIRRINRKPSVVLVWKSNDKPRELTTRKEYFHVFERWFPGFEKCKRKGKGAYYDQIIPSSEKFLCAMLENASDIAREICKAADVE
ncbi:MAG: hypothetical protein H8E17_10015 [Deltaproteobacteria bacterium]|nr:hypothetical protein [Deltaproteobacteria bacterium]MBL7204740.1 hypothetical protein [Desulfobacteraceae bacterium]